MTREEAIKILQGAIKKPNTKDGYLGQAIDMAIKALEQEPFINKPCVSIGVCHEDKIKVLDKIRTEIGKAWYTHPKNRYEEGLKDQALKDMKILDKYKAESEG